MGYNLSFRRLIVPTSLSRPELLRLAAAGAQARLRELQQEIASIYRSFPQLRRSGSSSRAAGDGATRGRRKRGRRTRGWTAAQRKAVSNRMKKYWAGRRNGQKK